MQLETMFPTLYSAVAQGILWGLMTIGVYITYKVLDYADLSVDGTFATGGAVSAVLIVSGMNPFLSLFFATLAGMAAGGVTGVLHTKLKIPAILSGILCMIALYSVNIRIMNAPQIPLNGETTIFTVLTEMTGLKRVDVTMIVGVIFAVAVIAVLYWFFGTEIGCCIRATGNNEFMVRALGGNTDNMKLLGLVMSNGLVSLAGALVAQQQGYSDVNMGVGTIVIGLASVIIGEVIFGKRFNFAYKLATVVFGSMIYRVIIAIVLYLGLPSTDLKLLTAVIVALALSVPVLSQAGFKKEG